MIELRHLRYFVAVAEELNFRRAAERVHIDQTPLSRTIRDLEDQLGVQLLVRAPRKLHLTPAGIRLLKEAHKVLIRSDRAFRAVRETDARFRAPLRIGVADGIIQPKLSECLATWPARAPEIPLALTEMRADELAMALQREELDAGFSFGLPENDALVQQPAWTYPIMALVPATHELASAPELSFPDLLAFPMVSCRPDRHPGLLQQMRTIIRRYAVVPTIAEEASTLAGYVTRVAANMGVGLVDAGHFAILRRSDVVAVPLVESESVTTFVVHKLQRFGPPQALKRFVAHATGSN